MINPNIIDFNKSAVFWGLKDRNIWRTSVQSVLIKNNTDCFYLCRECRAEFVRPSHPLISSRSAEVIGVAGNKFNFLLRNGSGIYHPFRRNINDELHFGLYNEGVEKKIVQLETEELSFDFLLDEFNKLNPMNDLIINVHFTMDDNDYQLVFPCGYMNFGNSKKTSDKYLQPISSDVLTEKDGKFYVSSFVAYIDHLGQETVEIVRRAPTDLLNVKKGICGKKTYSILNKIPRLLPNFYKIDEFVDVSIIEKCSIKFLIPSR